MAKVVYVLGAGFNCSILGPSARTDAPLARNFFQVFLKSRNRRLLDAPNMRVFVDPLLEIIQRYWKLDVEKLGSTAFDIEECFTFLESELIDKPQAGDALPLRNAAFALRYLLLIHLGYLNFEPVPTLAAMKFGSDVLNARADVLTFNYDTLAEKAVQNASGFVTPYRHLPPPGLGPGPPELADEYLDWCQYSWNYNLAYGVTFAEVEMPMRGIPICVSGDRYYGHPSNGLYKDTRVLKLHGSTDWLKYTPIRRFSQEIDPEHEQNPPDGILLSRFNPFGTGELPERNGWYLYPEIIAPQLNKQYDREPFPVIWKAALQSLSECERLIVIGYSFPPTDFRTRRLFLEAFSDHNLGELTVVNPDSSVIEIVRYLTHYGGPVTSCDTLQSLYSVPASLIPSRPAPQGQADPHSAPSS
jgi:hypothetical protein